MVFNGILDFITYGTNKCLLSYLVPLVCINHLFSMIYLSFQSFRKQDECILMHIFRTIIEQEFLFRTWNK